MTCPRSAPRCSGPGRAGAPGLDDKRLTSWNALMISALADAGAVLGRPDYLDAAVACAPFVLSESTRRRRSSAAHLEGRARTARRAIWRTTPTCSRRCSTLYETTFRPALVSRGGALADMIIERFSDAERGAFFTTPVDHERLIARRKDLEDSPIPSGNSAAAFGLLRARAAVRRARATSATRSAYCGCSRSRPLGIPHAFGHLLARAGLPPRAAEGGGPDRRRSEGPERTRR